MNRTQPTLSANDAESIKHALIAAIPQFAAHMVPDQIAESLAEACARLDRTSSAVPSAAGTAE